MPEDHQFGLFVEDGRGPLWRGFYHDLEIAKKKGEELADKEGLEFFIFNFKNFSEIARFSPPASKREASAR
jgi:hypothetical protein